MVAIAFLLLFSFLLLRAQKKKQEKGTPASPGPAGSPYFSPRAAEQMGEGRRKLPLARNRAPEKLPECDIRPPLRA
jgi:hypothetical protein